ncbi:HAMP domain-containing sensor histidine kinase [Dactylosporangium sp. NPDC049140]|uniref:sensor histidine kinase n=1 Tax=Dactylosporangium sp. NPDC049140 TaxID=3155647 RepID=UPI0033D4C2C6
MRLRLVLLVAATNLLVLAAFLVPLAVMVRSSAADRAVNAAVAQAQALAPTVGSLDEPALTLVLDHANGSGPYRFTVFLPNGHVLGVRAARSAAVAQAADGSSLTAPAAGGREVLVAVAGLPDGTAVVRTFVSDTEMRRGVGRAWLVLAALGLALLVVSVLVADNLARSLTQPLSAVAAIAHRLAGGDLDARAARAAGPPEVREVGGGLNLLADRIGALLARERETAADLSHRLRTPLTALRIDAESLRDPADQARITAGVDALERTVNEVIRAARRPVNTGDVPMCDAVQVVGERLEFWSPLADEEHRRAEAWLATAPLPVQLPRDDLSALVDALLGNVFAHTLEGTGYAVRLDGRAGGGARLVVLDEGPGLPESVVPRRGHSGAGSTGLGLDIVQRAAVASGGGITLGQAPGGGAMITVELGPPPGSLPVRRSPAHRQAPASHGG